MARYIPLPPSSRKLIKRIEKGLPEYFPRADAEKWTNGLFTGNYLDNLCYQGLGPKTHMLGKKSVILKEDFIEWLTETYIQGDLDERDIEGNDGVPEGLA